MSGHLQDGAELMGEHGRWCPRWAEIIEPSSSQAQSRYATRCRVERVAETRRLRSLTGVKWHFLARQKTSGERGDSPFLRHASAVLKQSKHKA